MSTDKLFISANELLQHSFALGHKILDSGFRPDYIVGIWRGGTPVGVAVQELLDFHGVPTDHIAIRTSSYDGIENQRSTVQVHGLHYIIEHADHDDNLLIIDDVFDSGRSVQAVFDEIKRQSRRNTPQMKTATVYYKPSKRKVELTPDFYMFKTEDWLVFPHELDGLNRDEILMHKPFAFRHPKEIPEGL